MIYKDEDRGKIRTCPWRKKQLFDVSGLRYGKITGTDMDLFIEMDDKVFLFYEFKYLQPSHKGEDYELPYGQRVAYTRLVDALCETGRTAVLFTCTHRVDDAEQEVTVDDLHVSKYYHKGKWYNCHGRPAKEITDLFLQHVAKVGA